VTVVGCGSSVGVEGKPMCYDVVTIEPGTKRWSVSSTRTRGATGVASPFRTSRLTFAYRIKDFRIYSLTSEPTSSCQKQTFTHWTMNGAEMGRVLTDAC